MVVVEEIEKIAVEVVVQLQKKQEKALIERGSMNPIIEKIDKEVEAIAGLMEEIVSNNDIGISFLSELTQIMEKRISGLMFMKDLVLTRDDPKGKELELKIGIDSSVFVRSKTDGKWMNIKAEFLQKGEIFTTETGQRVGEEYKFISMFPCDSDSLGMKVEKVRG